MTVLPAFTSGIRPLFNPDGTPTFCRDSGCCISGGNLTCTEFEAIRPSISQASLEFFFEWTDTPVWPPHDNPSWPDPGSPYWPCCSLEKPPTSVICSLIGDQVQNPFGTSPTVTGALFEYIHSNCSFDYFDYQWYTITPQVFFWVDLCCLSDNFWMRVRVAQQYAAIYRDTGEPAYNYPIGSYFRGTTYTRYDSWEDFALGVTFNLGPLWYPDTGSWSRPFTCNAPDGWDSRSDDGWYALDEDGVDVVFA